MASTAITVITAVARKQRITPNAGPALPNSLSSPGKVSHRISTIRVASPESTTAGNDAGTGSFGSVIPSALTATTAIAAMISNAAKIPAPNSQPIADSL
ncbi:hypothetical protein BH20ACT5_BH20ACT5_00520 [soil metagenome]